jgi:hypothetical protein
MKPMAKSRWSPAFSKPANSLPVLNAAAPRESGTPLRIPDLLSRRLAIALSFAKTPHDAILVHVTCYAVVFVCY